MIHLFILNAYFHIYIIEATEKENAKDEQHKADNEKFESIGSVPGACAEVKKFVNEYTRFLHELLFISIAKEIFGQKINLTKRTTLNTSRTE